MFQWQNDQEGRYVIGNRTELEPHSGGTVRARTRRIDLARTWRGTPIYDSCFRVLENTAQIAAAEQRIAAICPQPTEDYPAITGRWND